MLSNGFVKKAVFFDQVEQPVMYIGSENTLHSVEIGSWEQLGE